MGLALQPSFSLDLDCPSRVVLQRLFARLSDGPHELRRTRVFGGGQQAELPDADHFVLAVAGPEQRVWSPWLNVDVAPQGEGARLYARFSPHPSMWILFVFAYIALSALFLFSLCFAAAQRMLGTQPWALYGTLGSGLSMLGLWGAAQVGQHLSRAQMASLRAELEQALTTCLR